MPQPPKQVLDWVTIILLLIQTGGGFAWAANVTTRVALLEETMSGRAPMVAKLAVVESKVDNLTQTMHEHVQASHKN